MLRVMTHVGAAGAAALTAIVFMRFHAPELWLWFGMVPDLRLGFRLFLNFWFLGWFWFRLKLHRLRRYWFLRNPVRLGKRNLLLERFLSWRATDEENFLRGRIGDPEEL